MAQSGMKTWHIYVLRDPRDNAVRYVGVTTNARKRYGSHLKTKDGTPRATWIRELLAADLAPTIEIIESGDVADYQAAEKHWIARFRADGCRLTNTTEGGNGTAGYEPTPEVRAKIGAAARGKKHTPERIAKVVAAHRALNRKLSDEHKANLSRVHKGKSISEEHRQRLLEANRGRVVSDETKAKISAKRKGHQKSPEWRAKLAASATGKKATPEARAKMSAQRRGRIFSPETRAKLSAVARAQPKRELLTRCKRGHAYDEANTRVNRDGSRHCRACHRERARMARLKKKTLPA